MSTPKFKSTLAGMGGWRNYPAKSKDLGPRDVSLHADDKFSEKPPARKPSWVGAKPGTHPRVPARPPGR